MKLWTIRIYLDGDTVDYPLTDVSITRRVGSAGKHAFQDATATVAVGSKSLSLRLIGRTEPTKAQIFEGTDIRFTGWISTDWNFSVKNITVKSCQLKLTDSSDRLKITVFESDLSIKDGSGNILPIDSRVPRPEQHQDWYICDPDHQDTSLVHRLISLYDTYYGTKTTVTAEASCTKKLDYFVLDAGDSLKEVLEQLLGEYRLDYRFEADDSIRIFSTDIDAEPETTVSSFIGELRGSGSVAKMKGLTVTYRRYESRKHELLGKCDHGSNSYNDKTVEYGPYYVPFQPSGAGGLKDWRIVVAQNLKVETYEHKIDGSDGWFVGTPTLQGAYVKLQRHGLCRRGHVYGEVYGDIVLQYTKDEKIFVTPGKDSDTVDLPYHHAAKTPDDGSQEGAQEYGLYFDKVRRASATTYTFSSSVPLDPGELVVLDEPKVLAVSAKVRVLEAVANPVTGVTRYKAEGADNVEIGNAVQRAETEEAIAADPDAYLSIETNYDECRMSDASIQSITATARGAAISSKGLTPGWTLNGTAIASTEASIKIDKKDLKNGLNTIECSVTETGVTTKADTMVRLIDDVTVVSVVPEYCVSPSATEAPTEGFSTDLPERTAGNTLWVRQIVTRSDGSTQTTSAMPVTGDKGDAGPQGPQGIQGEKGEKGDTGTVAPDFILSASATSWAVSPRGVCHRDQTISVVCTRLGTDKPATWKLDPEWDASKMETSADTSILVLSADRGDSPVETVVTCSVAGAGSRTITISPVSDTADAPLYLGTDWDETETKTVEGDPLRTGDYYLKFTGDGNAVPRVYDEKAGWSDVEPGSASAAAICGTVLPDVLANKKNIQETSAALYAYIGTLAAQSASIRQLSPKVITSANYAEDSDGNPTAGYRLDGPKDVIKSANMLAMNASIKNSSLSNVSIANTLGEKGISITQEQENAPARKIMGTVASELSDPLEAEGEGGYSLVRDLSGQLSSGLVQASWSYNGKSGNAYWVRDGRLCLTNAYPVSPYWDLHKYAFYYGNYYSYQKDPGHWRQYEQFFGADASGTACRLTDGSRLSDLNKGSFKGRGFKLLFYWRDTATGATWVSRGVTSMSFRVTFWFDYYKSANCYWVDWLNGSGTKTLPSGVSISGVSAWSTGNISDRQVDVTATVRFSA